jgi:hypothetical protein
VKRSFLGRLDIYTQRLSDWLGAFPRWHGGTWANPPERLDRTGLLGIVDEGTRPGTFDGLDGNLLDVEWTGRVMEEAVNGRSIEVPDGVFQPGELDGVHDRLPGLELVQESERGFGYHGEVNTGIPAEMVQPQPHTRAGLADVSGVRFPAETPHGDEPGEKLNTFGPGVDPEVSQDAVTATALIPSEHVKAMRETGKRIMDTITNIREVQEAAQIREATEGPVFRSDANLKDIAEERKGDGYTAPVPETLKKIDPRIIEADRQENLPPHAKNLEQKVAKLPPGRGKGQPRKEPRSSTRTTSQWKGRYCKECGRHSGGPRSTRCQHCFEPFA